MTSSPEIEPSTPSTAGQLLRQARTKAGVHLAVLSVHLKVPVRQLEALEADELDPGKGPVFYRGLAASICRQLNTDPGPVLALLPSLSGQMSPIQTSNLPAGSLIESSRRRTSWGQVFSGKVFWLGFVLLALTLSFVWMPSPAQWAIWDGWHFSFFKPSSSGQLTEEVKLQPPLSPAPVPAPAPADSTANAPATTYPTAHRQCSKPCGRCACGSCRIGREKCERGPTASAGVGAMGFQRQRRKLAGASQ
jgi:cytoskeleton protein RodZ